MKAYVKLEPGTTLLVLDLFSKVAMFLGAIGFLAGMIVVGIVFQMLGGSLDSAFVNWFAIQLSGG
jgi:hypothetical protein